jgi:hypothetical protein
MEEFHFAYLDLSPKGLVTEVSVMLVCWVYYRRYQLAARDGNVSAAVVATVVQLDEAFTTAVNENACLFEPFTTNN